MWIVLDETQPDALICRDTLATFGSKFKVTVHCPVHGEQKPRAVPTQYDMRRKTARPECTKCRRYTRTKGVKIS